VARRTLRLGLLAAVVVAAVALAALLSSLMTPSTSEATGVVVAVDSPGGLGDVRGFTLRVAGGELLTFSLRALENAAEFPPGHLSEHQATAAPVRVVYRMEGSERLAIHLEDAPG
jgi:hydrogenase maturation factor HypF (carbamoyltransferase family)